MDGASRLRENYVGMRELRGSTHVAQERSVWFIWLVSFNQTNETDQTNQITVFLRWRTFQHPARERSAFDDNIACDFAARAEGLLRFAIEFGFDPPGVTERQHKLVLASPCGLFSWS